MNFTLKTTLIFVFFLSTACEKAKNDTVSNEPIAMLTISKIDKNIRDSRVYDCNYVNSPIFFIVKKVKKKFGTDNTYVLCFEIGENNDYTGPDYSIDEINWALEDVIGDSTCQHYSGEDVTVSFANGTQYYDLQVTGVVTFDDGSEDVCIFRQYNTENDGTGLEIIEGTQVDCYYTEKATYTLILP